MNNDPSVLPTIYEHGYMKMVLNVMENIPVDPRVCPCMPLHALACPCQAMPTPFGISACS